MRFVRSVLDNIQFKTYCFATRVTDAGITLRASFLAPCVNNPGGPPTLQWGRIWLIPDPEDEDSILKTAFLAVKQCEEHELMEFFNYKGQRPFDPHRSLV